MSQPNKTPVFILFLFGCLLYINTVPHDYALDDKIVITENQFTKEGFAGIADIFTTDSFQGFYGKKTGLVAGGRYRPLSVFTFAVEYGLFGKNPFFNHLFNVLLYGISGMLLFMILGRCFPATDDRKWYLSIPFITTALFLAHPLHTEVVANIKGRDEILCLFLSLGSLFYFMKFLDSKKYIDLFISSASIFLAMMSKETAITFLLIIPLTIYFFTEHPLKKNILSMVPLTAFVGIYLIIRFQVLGAPNVGAVNELMNNPFTGASASDKFATISYTFGKYLQLLVFPHPLTHDYYPKQIPIINWQDYRALIPLIIYIGITIYAFATFFKKKVVTFGILFYLITFSIVSNVVFPIGTFMNERFMYFPSIGFCLIIAYLFNGASKRVIKNNPVFVSAIFIAILLFYSIKTVSRNVVWKNDYTLSLSDVTTSSNSAKANMSAGSSLVKRAKEVSSPTEKLQLIQRATQYLTRSIKIYPTYHHSWILLGNAYYEIEDYNSAMDHYEQCIKIAPRFTDVINNILHVSQLSTKKKKYEVAIRGYKILIKFQPKNTQFLKELGQLYGKDLNDRENALVYLSKAQELDPSDTDILQKIGVVYAMEGEHLKAIHFFSQALELESNNPYILMNIGIAYNSIGEIEKGKEFLDRAFEIDPSLRK